MKRFFLCLSILFTSSVAAFAQANFYIYPASGCAPFCIAPQDSSVGGTAWYWDFGDASAPSTVHNPYHCYTNPGVYTVTLIETFAGGPDTATASVMVYPLPVASFTYSVSGNTVTFTDQSTNATSWYWNFGDNTSSSLQNPVHTYASAGNYYAMLQVASGTGCTDSTYMQIVATPVEEFFAAGSGWSFYPNPAHSNVTIHFDAPLEKSIPVRVENVLAEMIFSSETKGDLTVDLSSQPAGIYFVRVGEGPAKKMVIE